MYNTQPTVTESSQIQKSTDSKNWEESLTETLRYKKWQTITEHWMRAEDIYIFYTLHEIRA